VSEEAVEDRLARYVGRQGEWPDLRSRITYPSRDQVVRLAVQVARPVPGHIIEFGTWKGHSVRTMRDELWMSAIWDGKQRGKRIYACDSFEGLPEDYEGLPAGNFATPVPKLTGIRIVKGFFEDSLTPALAKEVGQVSLAHLDADLESATTTALDWLTPLLRPGSLLLFDEFIGEDPAEERAFVDWTERTGVKTTMLAMFGREPSGRGARSDRRALFQVVGDTELRKAPALFPTRIRRKLATNW
jgi:hypothetical protein